MFTESAGANQFRVVTERPSVTRSLGWHVERGDDGCSARIARGNDALLLVAGRQIVTAERLEVLALGCAHEFPDGGPIREVIRAVVDRGALAVIPWGFGKWIGRRGRIVRDLVEHAGGAPLFLGDNGGRPGVWPRPAVMAWAETQGVRVLGGSDPLPLPHHATRAGSYGFILNGWQDHGSMGLAVTSRIRALQQSPPEFGALSSLPAAVRAQAGLRWRQRHRGEATSAHPS
jgi:hypothetical protein